ncbi:MAG: hypothetical protein OIF50_15725, partial [Flavobacteriaceae bacterium]|nr:hypothetical protein [Flavobacteriaceae bacterium]
MMTFNYIRKGNWLFPVKPPKQKGYHFLLLVSFLLFSFTTWSQVGPGGETTNLKLWFKADSGVTETSGTLSAWAEASNNTSVTETVNGDPQFTSIGINFNPYISFDGTGDQVLTGSHLDLSGQNAGSIFMVYATETVSRDVIFGVTNTGELDMELQILGDSKIGLNDGGVENFVSSSNAINDGAFRIASALRNDVNWSLFSNADGGSTNTSGPTSNFGTGTYGISPTSAFMYTGKIAEVIVFNADVTSARPKIESYLAMKYGLTMDQTTATDYVSSA